MSIVVAVAAGGAPIVLFHDSLGCVALWRDFPAALAEATGRKVIAYDRFGFGQSAPHPGGWSIHFIEDEARRYFPLLRQALDIGRFVAFGYSVGGVMAGAAAQRQSGVAAMRARQVFAEPTALKPWRERADEILGDSQRKR